MKKIAIVQSNYIPWKGYFDLIHLVDEFVLYDDAQYRSNDWRNRNKIKTWDGIQWLSIPIAGKTRQKIKDATVQDADWNSKHWKAICANYTKAKYFGEYKSFFEKLYLECRQTHLSGINHHFLTAINELLGIKTRLSWSMDYTLPEGKTEKLVAICKQAGASFYLSGPAAKDYLEEALFDKEGIEVSFMDYSGYPEYTQLFSPFEHAVSILDLIFNEGPNATKFMKSFL